MIIIITQAWRRFRPGIFRSLYSPCFHVCIPVASVLPALNVHRNGNNSTLLNRILVNLIPPLGYTNFSGIFPWNFKNKIPLTPRSVLSFTPLLVYNLNNLSAQFNVHTFSKTFLIIGLRSSEAIDEDRKSTRLN